MSDSMKKMKEDIEDYIRLCRYFNEDPRFVRTAQGPMVEDCYGDHAKILNERKKQEEKNGIQRCPHCCKRIN